MPVSPNGCRHWLTPLAQLYIALLKSICQIDNVCMMVQTWLHSVTDGKQLLKSWTLGGT